MAGAAWLSFPPDVDYYRLWRSCDASHIVARLQLSGVRACSGASRQRCTVQFVWHGCVAWPTAPSGLAHMKTAAE